MGANAPSCFKEGYMENQESVGEVKTSVEQKEAKKNTKQLKVKKVTNRRIVKNKSAKIIRDQKGDEHIVVIEEETYYTFKNMRPGPMHFKRSNGKEDFFEGFEIKKDIGEMDKDMLINSQDYKNGWLVQEFVNSEEALDKINNANAFSDRVLNDVVSKNKDNIKELEKIVEQMDSEFAIKRIKDIFIRYNLPSSLVVYCDYKLKQIEEKFLEDNKEPLYTKEND